MIPVGWTWRLGAVAVATVAALGGTWHLGAQSGARGVRLEWARADAVERTDDARQRQAWAEERDWLTRQAAQRAVAVVRADQGTVAEEAKQVETIKTVYRTIRERAESLPLRVDCSLPADGLRLWNAANAGQLSAAAVSDAAARLPDGTAAAAAAGR